MTSRIVQVDRRTLLAALIKRETVDIAEGKPPRVSACEWCGKLVAGKRNRPPPRFCRVPAKCASKADNAICRTYPREPYLIGPLHFDDWVRWQRQVGGREVEG
jgi:hypothetical protein